MGGSLVRIIQVCGEEFQEFDRVGVKKMEGYGRPNKGGGGMCGLNRGQQTLLFMVLMVGSMILVLCWESTPFTSEINNPPHRDGSSTSTSISRSVDGAEFYETGLLDSRSLQSNCRVMSSVVHLQGFRVFAFFCRGIGQI